MGGVAPRSWERPRTPPEPAWGGNTAPNGSVAVPGGRPGATPWPLAPREERRCCLSALP